MKIVTNPGYDQSKVKKQLDFYSEVEDVSLPLQEAISVQNEFHISKRHQLHNKSPDFSFFNFFFLVFPKKVKIIYSSDLMRFLSPAGSCWVQN